MELSKIVQESVNLYKLKFDNTAKYTTVSEGVKIEYPANFLISSQISLLEAELERKKGMLMTQTKEESHPDWFYGYGYNQAITEDIAYLEKELLDIKAILE